MGLKDSASSGASHRDAIPEELLLFLLQCTVRGQACVRVNRATHRSGAGAEVAGTLSVFVVLASTAAAGTAYTEHVQINVPDAVDANTHGGGLLWGRSGKCVVVVGTAKDGVSDPSGRVPHATGRLEVRRGGRCCYGYTKKYEDLAEGLL